MSEILGGIVEKAKSCVEDSTGLLLVIAGQAATTALVEAVRTWAPEVTEGVADETVASVAGFLLFYFGDRIHPRLKSLGFGILLAGIGAWASAWIAPLFEMLKKKG